MRLFVMGFAALLRTERRAVFASDVAEVCAVLDAVQADRRKIILMPEGTDPAVLRERSVWLAELCKREGFRYSPRLHVDLYGNTRGT